MNKMKSIMKHVLPLVLCVIVFLSFSDSDVAFAQTASSSDSSKITISTTSSTDSIKSISLDNFKNVVYVKDFGAVGDGVHDDAAAINQAITSGADAVVFDANATYKCTDYIKMTKPNVTIIGNNATLFTDNDYRTRTNYYEWFFNVTASNITIDGINIEARETILVGYKTQFMIRLASNVTVQNCTFYIPSTVLSDATTRDVEYSNCDVYTGWHNVTITNCVFTQLADTKAGGTVGFRDIWSKGCDTAVFTNNICTSNSHDEMFALFASNATISNITVTNNQFYGLEGATSKMRNIGITLGYKNNRGISGLTFTDNIVDVKSDYILFWLGDSSDVNIANNDIKFQPLASGSTAYLIRSFSTVDNNVSMTNNAVSVENNIGGLFGGLASGIVTFSSNDVKLSTPVTNSLFNDKCTAIGNTIQSNSTIKLLSTSAREISDNIINGKITLK